MSEKEFKLNRKWILIKDTESLENFSQLDYAIGSNGVFKKIKNKMFSAVIKDKNSPLAEIDESCEYNISKMPHRFMKEIINFFTAVYDKHSSEAMVILYHNFDTKEWLAVPPTQKVSSTSVNWSSNEIQTPEGFTNVGSIHSHGSMSAFHSGVDDADEFDWDGLHITIGTIRNPTFAIRFICAGQEFAIDSIDTIVEKEENGITFPEEWMDKVSGTSNTYKGGWSYKSKKDDYNQTRLTEEDDLFEEPIRKDYVSDEEYLDALVEYQNKLQEACYNPSQGIRNEEEEFEDSEEDYEKSFKKDYDSEKDYYEMTKEERSQYLSDQIRRCYE